MRGSVFGQVNYLWARTWHEIGKNLGVHNYLTKAGYLNVWRQTFAYAKENYGVRDIEKLGPNHISTFHQYCAAVEKLEQSLTNYSQQKGISRTYDFSEELKEIRGMSNESAPRFEGTRAYLNPDKVIEIRVFPRRTKWTPTDDLAFIGDPPLGIDLYPSSPRRPLPSGRG